MALSSLNSGLMLTLHLLSAVIWVGGMFFAYVCLRPVAAAQFEPPQRLTLWAGVFSKFFPFVWLTIITLLATGYGMIFNTYGGFANAPIYVHVMQGIAIIMMLIFMHVFFAPFKRIKTAVITEDWPSGASSLNQIRKLIGINLTLGLLTIIIASIGPFFVN